MRLTPYEKWELKDKSAKASFELIDEIIKNWQEAPNKVVQWDGRYSTLKDKRLMMRGTCTLMTNYAKTDC